MVWYRVRIAVRSWTIVIIVLLLHGILVYLLLVACTKHGLPSPAKQIESAPVFFMNNNTLPNSIPASSNQKPEHRQSESQPLTKDLLFASLYQKASGPDDTETTKTTDLASPESDPEPVESPITDLLTVIKEVEKQEKPLTPDIIAPEKVIKPPVGVATDDIPIDFEGGVHNTQLSAQDSLFHTFIKAVNTALYKSIHEGIPPFTLGIQPIAVRMVIIRTGRLAQRPTIVRSSGNPARDSWYIDAIMRASAAFPPIPNALQLPFAEFIFREGSKALRP